MSQYAIEGLDRLGKSTLIRGLVEKLGYHQIIHFEKPQRLAYYENEAISLAQHLPELIEHVPEFTRALYLYQRRSFDNSMKLVRSGANIIFDRWHLGECVYSPLYRKYSGEYVFDLERAHFLNVGRVEIKLILLTEAFDVSKHFVDDGESFDPAKRREEQEAFIEAFDKSIIPDKRVVCVTDRATGGFRPSQDILAEVLA